MLFYAFRRLKQLNVEELFQGLIALKDHGVPRGINESDVRYYYYSDPKIYETNITYIKEYTFNLKKPSTKVLIAVLNELNIKTKEVIYIGDSLHKDVFMAQSCGVYDVYAKYGREYDKELYKQLIEITHWKKVDIDNHINLKKIKINPTFTVDSFKELITIVKKIEKIRN